jgi:gas vesicle protein
MSLQTVVDDVKGRVETLTSQGQKVAQISLETLKQTGEIVADKFQVLVKTESAAAKELYTSAKLGLDKALADGLKAVAAAPISYLPPKDKFVTVYTDTVTLVSTTGDAVYKTLKTGFTTIQAEILGETVEKKVKAPKKAAAKKAASAKTA